MTAWVALQPAALFAADWEQRVHEGDQLFEQRAFADAVTAYQQGVAIDVTDDWAERLREARQFLDQQAFQQAINSYREVLNIATANEPPLIVAGLRCELGWAMSWAGQAESGLSEMVKALHQIRMSGEATPLAICAHLLGLHYRTAGKYDEARHLFHEAIFLEEKSSRREKQLADVLISLAGLETLEGAAGRADEHARRALRILENIPGIDDFELALAYRVNALTSRALFRNEDALRFTEREIHLRRRIGPAEAPELVHAICLMAAIHAEMRRFNKAEEWLRQLAVHSHRDDVRLKTSTTAAYVASQRGDLRKAERAFEDAVATMQNQKDASRLELATLWTHLGRTKRRLGNYAGSEQCHWRAMATLQGAKGDTHTFVAFAWLDLADTYRLMRRYEEATTYYRKGLALVEAFAGKASGALAIDYYMFATVLQKRNSKAEAREYFALAKEANGKRGDVRMQSFTIDASEFGKRR